jgi:hypothetical protein
MVDLFSALRASKPSTTQHIISSGVPNWRALEGRDQRSTYPCEWMVRIYSDLWEFLTQTDLYLCSSRVPNLRTPRFADMWLFVSMFKICFGLWNFGKFAHFHNHTPTLSDSQNFKLLWICGHVSPQSDDPDLLRFPGLREIGLLCTHHMESSEYAKSKGLQGLTSTLLSQI